MSAPPASAFGELAGQQQRGAALAPAVILERLAAAGGIGGDGAEQLAQLLRARRVERAVGALAEAGDLAEGAAGARIAPLVEDEGRDAEEAELAGAVPE